MPHACDRRIHRRHPWWTTIALHRISLAKSAWMGSQLLVPADHSNPRIIRSSSHRRDRLLRCLNGCSAIASHLARRGPALPIHVQIGVSAIATRERVGVHRPFFFHGVYNI